MSNVVLGKIKALDEEAVRISKILQSLHYESSVLRSNLENNPDFYTRLLEVDNEITKYSDKLRANYEATIKLKTLAGLI